MKEELKKQAAKVIESFGEDILISRGCGFFWGEVELPECLRKEVESEEE